MTMPNDRRRRGNCCSGCGSSGRSRFRRCPAVGSEAYATREQWVQARRKWEARRGQSLREWYYAASAEARAERGFDGWAAMIANRADPDEDPPCDPCDW